MFLIKLSNKLIVETEFLQLKTIIFNQFIFGIQEIAFALKLLALKDDLQFVRKFKMGWRQHASHLVNLDSVWTMGTAITTVQKRLQFAGLLYQYALKWRV